MPTPSAFKPHSNTPANLVRLNIHINRKQVPRLTTLAERISEHKRRGVRLGEALELVLSYASRISDDELLQRLSPDEQCQDWLSLPLLHRDAGCAIPRALHSASAKPTQR